MPNIRRSIRHYIPITNSVFIYFHTNWIGNCGAENHVDIVVCVCARDFENNKWNSTVCPHECVCVCVSVPFDLRIDGKIRAHHLSGHISRAYTLNIGLYIGAHSQRQAKIKLITSRVNRFFFSMRQPIARVCANVRECMFLRVMLRSTLIMSDDIHIWMYRRHRFDAIEDNRWDCAPLREFLCKSNNWMNETTRSSKYAYWRCCQ